MHGHVRTTTGHEPIVMIKVGVYGPLLTLIDRAHTNDDGSYSVDVSAGDTVTVRFDTHPSLNNADDWRPSPATDVVADDTVPLGRHLVPVGEFADTARGIDVIRRLPHGLGRGGAGVRRPRRDPAVPDQAEHRVPPATRVALLEHFTELTDA